MKILHDRLRGGGKDMATVTAIIGPGGRVSGRTISMIHSAICAAASGNRIICVVPNESRIPVLQSILDREVEGHDFGPLSIKFMTVEMLKAAEVDQIVRVGGFEETRQCELRDELTQFDDTAYRMLKQRLRPIKKDLPLRPMARSTPRTNWLSKLKKPPAGTDGKTA